MELEEDTSCDECCKEPKVKLHKCPCGAWLCDECFAKLHPEMVQACACCEEAA